VSKKPNIILFITHDQGQYLGCYDSPQTPNSLETPNLDKLADNGVRFTNTFVQRLNVVQVEVEFKHLYILIKMDLWDF